MQSTFDIIHPACVLTSWLLGVCVVRINPTDGEEWTAGPLTSTEAQPQPHTAI